MGTALDNHRYQPGSPGAGAYSPDVRSDIPYYLLADSPEGVKKEAEITGQVPPPYQHRQEISKKALSIRECRMLLLKSIANNPDIKEGMSRKEIDAAIARHAETETLYDQPYEDNKRVRVTGPFTVESLSPHRFVSLDEEKPAAEKSAQKDDSAGQFEAMITGKPQESRCAEYRQERKTEIRPAGTLCRGLYPGRRRIYR